MIVIPFLTRNIKYNRIICKRLHNSKLRSNPSSRLPQSVFLEKVVEEPVIVAKENNDVDIIGPPDPVSNLRPIIRKCPLKETTLQQQLRQMQDATQLWNQEFWTKHNTNFLKERKEYIRLKQNAGEGERQLTADEMSEFYKKFLDKNWHLHLKYNVEWYRKNCTLLYLSLWVCLEKIYLKIL